MKISPYQKTILKSKLKKIETMTLRCNNCYYIPRFKLNLESQNLLVICDKCNKNFNEENKIFQIDLYAFIRLFLEENKCKLCKKNDNHLYLDDNSNSIICDSCIHKRNIKFKDGDKNYIYNDSKISNNLFNLNGDISLNLDEFEKPLNPAIVKKYSNLLLLSKTELNDLKTELNKYEEKCNQYYNSRVNEFYEYNKFEESKDKIINIYTFIFFCISFIRSLIYTYEDMIKNDFLNYNIIYNIRKIKINKDNIESTLIPFYNVCINKYFLEEKDKNKLNDEYTHEKLMEYIKIKILDGKNHKCNISENNDLIFIYYERWQQTSFQIFRFDPFDEINFDENQQSKLTPRFPVLNFLNYIFQINDNKNSIIIYTYSIINNKIEFFEYQKIELNELYNSYKDHEIYSDNKTNKVYFFLKNLKKIIVLTKNENKKLFDEKIYYVDYIFNSNNIYKFSDNIIYIFRENDFIEINLDNNKERRINISKGNFGNFIDFDDLNIILVCSLNDEKCFFAFVNKKTFKLEKERYYFETKNNNKKIFIKMDNNHIFYAGYIFYITDDKRIITINDCYFNSNIKFNGFFKKNGETYFLFIEPNEVFKDQSIIILCQLKNPYEYNYKYFELYKYYDKSLFNKYSKYTLYNYDKLPVRRFEIFNIFRNKILTCPYCSFIPSFYINYYTKINCYLHSISESYSDKYNNIYDIEDFLYNYNDLDSTICYYCGTQNNLFFFLETEHDEIKLLYTCKNCMNNYKKPKYKTVRLIDINNSYKCVYHNKNLNINYLCDECIEERKECIYKDGHLNEEFDYIDLSSIQENNYEEEKLENILYTEKEIEELKSKIKIIETKINNY